MRKMQALQPQLKAIQDRYAGLKVTDPARQKMNTEIMNLYREKGVNPASGCVPMLLTMPVLFAFYSLLSQAIELRGAEFGCGSRISPSTIRSTSPRAHGDHDVLAAADHAVDGRSRAAEDHDDDAADVRRHVPWAPSGLVLYWFVSNLWAIGQQYFTNWMIGPPALATARPPAERRMKSAGAGRTAAAERKTLTRRRGRSVNETLTKQIADFVQSVVSAMGVSAHGHDRRDAGRHAHQPRGRRRRRPDPPRRRRPAGAAAPRRHGVSAAARRRQPHRRRLQRVPQGQGRRDQADGALHGREGAIERHAARDGPAQSVRAPHRAPGDRRGSDGQLGEHRRCVHEDRDHFGQAVSSGRRVGNALRGTACSLPTTPSWRSRRRPDAVASVSCGSAERALEMSPRQVVTRREPLAPREATLTKVACS